ncbi:ATP-binding cassette domain-containing protein [Actinomadura rupiterrae]|uniref:ATP-binding cassette domain-containing protein n=1 Tax=Actinomadura rupiterrae TaxID=559627 RepID=UPI0020A322BC|nr:ATP-binding cassette domain-containing protein [Actinomadura rupiterrae]MCP2343581.1 ABC-2 type transport system ATP-binding protein [Actinomadura rupiterrae]
MIELRRLSKRYRTSAVLDDLTATVGPGQVTALVGPHEAGKTTVLRLIVGLVAPTRGTATVMGRRYADLPDPMRRVGVLLDPPGAHGGLRVRDHLLWLARSNGIPRRRVAEVCGLTGLDGTRRHRIRTLPPGLRLRLAVAGTLLGDPETLIYDSPAAGFAPAGADWAGALLRGLAGAGRTVLVTGRRIDELDGVAERFLVLHRGRLVADGSADDLMRADAAERVLVRCDDPGYLARRLAEAGAVVRFAGRDGLLVTGLHGAEIHRLTVRCAVRLHELTPQRTTLEQAYRVLTTPPGTP